MDNDKTLKSALFWAGLGHPVFPIHGVAKHRDGRWVCTCGDVMCVNPGKHPFARFAPRGLLSATTDPEVIGRWFRNHRWLNYGVSTQELLVIDIDARKGGAETWAALEREYGAVPASWMVLTGGGGEHRIFQPVDGIRNSAGKLGAGIDVRAGGGYIVGVNSRHINSGREYVFDVDHHPDHVELAQAPDWLIEKLVEPRYKQARSPEHWRNIANGVSEGLRTISCTSLAGKLAYVGFPPDVNLALCLAVNQRNQPPEDEAKVTRDVMAIIARDLARGR